MDRAAAATISKLQKELELSGFLNKGVLSTNKEQKARIAELEDENAVLRTTESKLAELEDKYEAQEKRLQNARHALAGATRRAAQLEKTLKGTEHRLGCAQAEAARCRGKYERLAAAVAQATSLFEDAEAEAEAEAEAAEPAPRGRFTLALPGSSRVPTVPPTAPAASDEAVAASSRASLASPSSSPRAMPARKRVRVTDEDDAAPPTARLLFPRANGGRGIPQRSSGTTTFRQKKVVDGNFTPKETGARAAASESTARVLRSRGRHSSPLPRRAEVTSALARPATAPRPRRHPAALEPEVEIEIDVKSEVESDVGECL
ncbi:unnamed protein product [Cutaneotrichosporon oleaginosum]